MMGLLRDPRQTRGLLDVRVLQHNERACSVACMAMLVNAARALHAPLSLGKPISQRDLLHRVGSAHWKSAVGPGGDGVTLDELADLAGQSLAACGIPQFEMDVMHVDRVTLAARTSVRHTLTEIASSAALFLVANFLHGVYTGDPHGTVGHYALIAGYDPAQSSVLVLDPDIRDYQPYWVSEEVFLDGMATHDEAAGRSRGYLSIRVGSRRLS
jgi:hypothetical protein